MRPNLHLAPRFLLFLLLVLSLDVAAQPAITSFTFDNGPDNWENEDANTPQPEMWEWSSDGRASGGTFWGARGPIRSASGPGALMLNSDSLSTAVDGAPHRATVRSPSIFLDSTLVGKKIGLCFNQYFRQGAALTSVRAELEGAPLSEPIRLNEHLRPGVETTDSNLVVVVLADSLPATGNLRIFFDFEGLLYFWLIDDVVLKTLPDYYGGTFPAYVGDSLALIGRPYAADSLGGAYVPNELVVRWAPGTTEQEKEDIREEFALVRSDTCLCREIESVILASELTLDPAANLIEFGDFEDANSNLYFALANTASGGCNLGTYSIVPRARAKCNLLSWADAYPPSGAGNMAVVYHNEQLFFGSDPDILEVPNIPLAQDETYFLSFDIYFGINDDAPEVPVLQTTDLGILQFLWDNDNSPTDRRIHLGSGGWFNYQAVFKAQGNGTSPLSLAFTNPPATPGEFAFGLDNFYMAPVSALGGKALDIIETKNGGGAKNMVQDIDFNYYTRSYFQPGTANANPGAIESSEQLSNLNIDPVTDDEVIIAIIDTGVDWDHACFQGKIWTNNTEYNAQIANVQDDDGNCVTDDFIGWNFVEDYNNPYDDHGHGTHVACIALENAEAFSPPDSACAYRIMPLKALAFDGVGELFDATCATLYAIQNGADVVNCSFIWNGGQSDIMDGLIDEGADVFFVVAAGNDTLDLGLHHYYPANYSGKENMLTVGAVDGILLAPFSNYNGLLVEVAAEGVKIDSALPDTPVGNTNRGLKSGTSMAAPHVAAAAAIAYCGLGPFPSQIRETILACADQVPGLMVPFVNGNVLNLDGTCLVVVEVEEAGAETEVRLFPNPTTGLIQAPAPFIQDRPFIVETYGLSGRLLLRKEQKGLLPGEPLSLDFSTLPAGMYVLRIRQGPYSWTGRFIKD